MHRNTILIYIQQDATLHSLFYLEAAPRVSGGSVTHHRERKQLYLHHLAFVTPLLLYASIVEELELVCVLWVAYVTHNTLHNQHSSVSTHSGHQPAATWVNTTRYCKYSQVLLMMGENIARNL
jgi:hypothetical protein